MIWKLLFDERADELREMAELFDELRRTVKEDTPRRDDIIHGRFSKFTLPELRELISVTR